MIAELLDSLVEELGNRGCPQAAQECTPEPDWPAIAPVLVGSAIFAALALAVSATISLLSARVRDRELLIWVAVIWLVPVAGAIIWLYVAFRGRLSEIPIPTTLSDLVAGSIRSRVPEFQKHVRCDA